MSLINPFIRKSHENYDDLRKSQDGVRQNLENEIFS